MIRAEDATVWINWKTKQVEVARGDYRWPRYHDWCDPIGVAYDAWKKGTDEQRVHLMLETAIDLAMQGYDLKAVLTEFAKVKEFRALGSESFPMCRALTKALLGECYEPNTMTFEELLERYA